MKNIIFIILHCQWEGKFSLYLQIELNWNIKITNRKEPLTGSVSCKYTNRCIFIINI